MKYGLSLLPDASPSAKSAVDYYRDALEMAAMADAGGMATVKMTEHYGQPYGGYCPDPLMFLVAVAQRTQHIRVMTGCLLPAFHHPVQLASRIAMADVLVGGRLDVGFARAFLPSEFDLLGLDLDESPARFEAVTRAVTELFAAGRASATGPFFSYHDVALLPPPLQRPHPPFWGAAARSRSSFARIGESGMHLLTAFTIQSPGHLSEQIAVYRESRADVDLLEPGQVAMLMPLFVDRDESMARRKGFFYLQRYHETWKQASGAWRGRRSTAYAGYTDLDRQLDAFSPEDLFANGSLAFGTPARVREMASEVAERFGINQILWNVDFGAMPRHDALASLGLFLEQCM